MEDSEVLLENDDKEQKREDTEIRFQASPQNKLAMMRIMEFIEEAGGRLAPGTELTFILMTEENRMSMSRKVIGIQNGMGFDSFFGEQSPALMDGARKLSLAIEDGRRQLSQAIARPMSHLEGRFVYFPDRRKGNLNAQVNQYVPVGRAVVQLRQFARKRR